MFNSPDFGMVSFVIWRECFEALLVIGIMYTWIAKNPDRKRGMRYLLGGVVLGIAVAVLLGFVIYGVFASLQGTFQDVFMIVMQVVACVLIVQMVYWMNKNSRGLKGSIEAGLSQSTQNNSWWGALLIVAIAIAREGSEIVVFLSSKIMNLNATTWLDFVVELVIGLILAIITFYAFIFTSRKVSWKKFFTVTGFLLLFLALSLLMSAVEKITDMVSTYIYENVEDLSDTSMHLLDFLSNSVWDTTAILNSDSSVGSLLATFFAYRSQPLGISVILFVVYWVIIAFIFLRGKKHA